MTREPTQYPRSRCRVKKLVLSVIHHFLNIFLWNSPQTSAIDFMLSYSIGHSHHCVYSGLCNRIYFDIHQGPLFLMAECRPSKSRELCANQMMNCCECFRWLGRSHRWIHTPSQNVLSNHLRGLDCNAAGGLTIVFISRIQSFDYFSYLHDVSRYEMAPDLLSIGK